MQVTIGGRVFPPVTVANKKEGRVEAAAMALKILMAEGSYQIQQDNTVNILEQVVKALDPRSRALGFDSRSAGHE